MYTLKEEVDRAMSHRSEGADRAMNHRSSTQRHSIVINRHQAPDSLSSSSSSSSMVRRESAAMHGSAGMEPHAYVTLSAEGVAAVKNSRQKEKKEMDELNKRLEQYMDKGREYEVKNRNLADELEKLKARWGKETEQIKALYLAELDDERRKLDNGVNERSRHDIKLARVDETIEELRDRLDAALREKGGFKDRFERQNQQLSDGEAELKMLRRRLEALENDKDKEKALIKKLKDGLNDTRSSLDRMTLDHIDAENKRQTLEEQLEFMNALHDQEVKELQALAYKDSTSENREFWKSEMGQALREIQAAYDDKLVTMRLELENYYGLKLKEFQKGADRQIVDTVHTKEEMKRNRDQLAALREKLAEHETRIGELIRDLERTRREKESREREMEDRNRGLEGDVMNLRAEMEAMLKELQSIIDAKLGLEMEIAAYRRMLEGEETRAGLRSIVDAAPALDGGLRDLVNKAMDNRQSAVTEGGYSARTSFQKSAKGSLTIYDTAPDGKFVGLENTGRKEESLGGWSVTRNVDGKDVASYKFNDSFVIRPGDKIKLWAKGEKPQSASSLDVEVDQPWGLGSHIVTKLLNPIGEDRATHIQKTTYG